MTTEPLN